MADHTGLRIHDQVEVVYTKACVTCDSLIDANLSTCPHCQSPQPDTAPRFRALLPSLVVIAALAALGFVVTNDRQVPDTADLPDTHTVEPPPPLEPVATSPEEDRPAFSNILLDAKTLSQCDADFPELAVCELSLSSFDDNLNELQELSEVDFANYCATVRQALLTLVGTSDPQVRQAFNRAYAAWRSCRDAR